MSREDGPPFFRFDISSFHLARNPTRLGWTIAVPPVQDPTRTYSQPYSQFAEVALRAHPDNTTTRQSRNPKPETRNPKQIQSTNAEMIEV
jgi:hypothetical protein